MPGDQYNAVHLIAFSSRRPQTIPRVDVRLGYVQRTADEWVDQAADVPYLGDAKSEKAVSSIPVKLADGSQGYLHHIRVPVPQTGQLREYDTLAVQFTRKLEIKPDEFMKRSLDADSGVHRVQVPRAAADNRENRPAGNTVQLRPFRAKRRGETPWLPSRQFKQFRGAGSWPAAVWPRPVGCRE